MSPSAVIIEVGVLDTLLALVTFPFRYNGLANFTGPQDAGATYHTLQVPYSAPRKSSGTTLSHSCHHCNQSFRHD